MEKLRKSVEKYTEVINNLALLGSCWLSVV